MFFSSNNNINNTIQRPSRAQRSKAKTSRLCAVAGIAAVLFIVTFNQVGILKKAQPATTEETNIALKSPPPPPPQTTFPQAITTPPAPLPPLPSPQPQPQSHYSPHSEPSVQEAADIATPSTVNIDTDNDNDNEPETNEEKKSGNKKKISHNDDETIITSTTITTAMKRNITFKELQAIPEFATYDTTPVPGYALEDIVHPKISTVNPNELTGVTFTHVYSPYAGQKSAEAHVVAASIEAATAYAAERGVRVEVVAAVLEQDIGSDDLVLASGAKVVTVQRVFSDVYPNPTKGSVPFVSDIIDASRAVAKGSFMILTNPDIVLEEAFYLDMVTLLERRPADWQAVTVNRRTIPVDALTEQQQQRLLESFHSHDNNNNNNVAELLRAVNSLQGEAHPGHDCFVFPMGWAGRLVEATRGFVVGSPVWGCWFRFLVCERQGGIEEGMDALRFKAALNRSHKVPCTYTKYNITRHIGNDKGWKKNVVPWIWNAMWLYIDVTRGYSGTGEYAKEGISSCKSRNPCSSVSIKRMTLSKDYQALSAIYNKSCALYKRVRFKYQR